MQINQMSTLTVLQFPTTDGAQETLTTLEHLQAQQAIQIDDAAIVTWPPDKRAPKTKHLDDMTGPWALGGAFWGLLFGLLFFVPLLGVAVGAGFGAILGSANNTGIDDTFVEEVRAKITPGTSALFLMTHSADLDRVAEAFKGTQMKVISTNLPADQERHLRETFSEYASAADPSDTPMAQS
jgi:uncharacterized membrane protein